MNWMMASVVIFWLTPIRKASMGYGLFFWDDLYPLYILLSLWEYLLSFILGMCFNCHFCKCWIIWCKDWTVADVIFSMLNKWEVFRPFFIVYFVCQLLSFNLLVLMHFFYFRHSLIHIDLFVQIFRVIFIDLGIYLP